ncbi:MAG TPA: C10 family peptidase [Bacteroidales bacterium]|nr:C10 family peptidase [Bacteroidales bacterium]
MRQFLPLLLFLGTITLYGQVVSLEDAFMAAKYHMEEYFPDGVQEFSGVEIREVSGKQIIFALSLEPEGWILVSGDKGARPVIGFSLTGSFDFPEYDPNNPNSLWIRSYEEQIIDLKSNPQPLPNPAWSREYYSSSLKSTSEEVKNVFPFIDVLWNQDTGWNRFCPADTDGPGGHVYVGCVAVAMAQAMSVYKVPDRGTGYHEYLHDIYGMLSVDYSQAEYKWDSMSLDRSDTYNALLLYHCAVGVDMDFGPDGSGTQTSKTIGAMRKYFCMSSRIKYYVRAYNEDRWTDILREELENGRPIIYKGDANNDEPGHAFNIDGVLANDYFHINWGWGGNDNGYFLIDNLSPGTSDFTENQAAIVAIQPYYYPTDIILNNYIVPEDELPGAFIGKLTVVDEATNNEYIISLKTDSSFIENEWIYDYYIENDSLKTGREFPAGEIVRDTVWFSLTDLHDNFLEVEVVLSFETTGSNSTGVDPERLDAVIIYPNPANDFVYISNYSSFEVRSIRIYSLSGKVVKQINLLPANSAIPVSDLQKGLYILEAEYDDGFIIRKKLVKN